MTKRWIQTLAATVAVMTLLMIACGSEPIDDSASATAATSTNDTAAALSDDSNDAETTPEPAGQADFLDNGAGQGFVELGGVRYDFDLSTVCQNIFGGLQVSGPLVDGSDGRIDAIIPPEDWQTNTAAGWDPPSVKIDIGDDSWLAEFASVHFAGGENVTLTAEQSSVTSFTNDGSQVTGAANFYSTFNFDEVETATGTFEFHC